MWWVIGFFSMLFGGYLTERLFERRKRLRTLRQSAEALRGALEVERSHLLSWRAKITARSGPLKVRITGVYLGAENEVAVEIKGLPDLSGVKVRRRLFNMWTGQLVGDKVFDDEFIVEGPIRAAAALLDARTRLQLVRAREHCLRLEVGDGRLRASFPEKEIHNILPLLLNLGHRLTEPLDVERQIFTNARRDTEPGVRIFNLLLLAREHPGDPETREALLAACSDESPAVRMRAALELGDDEGRDVLLKVAESTEDDESSAKAVTRLGGRLPFDRAKGILSQALHMYLPETACACLEVLGRHKAAAVGVLAPVLAEQKGKVAIAAAKALGATAEQAAEVPLLQALHSEESEVREAAAAALGKVGSVAAVQPLEDATERFWLDLGLRQAARQAIAGIQARTEGATPGQLSLAGADEAGQLSLAQSEAGQLTLTQDELGLLAFPMEETEQPPQRTGATQRDGQPGAPGGRRG